MPDAPCPYVSRGGLKLAAALDAFAIDARGATCADLGCNAGGFTDCLLQRGAVKVYAVDTGYGALAWKLRQDQRVVVMERTNAIHFDPRKLGSRTLDPRKLNPRKPSPRQREDFPGCDLVAIDLGWTRQAHALPAAVKWLRGPGSRIVTLVKPHYEADRSLLPRSRKGVLSDADAEAVLPRVLGEIESLGLRVLGHMRSPIRGGAGKGHAGNVEFLALLRVAEAMA